ncbi:hypothetical protein BRADI_1g27846v3 [Brachypodium distachyon]|uniref:Uncharacterized protein n=1 Tax=Brachypodium distachyon TaxID=15368 RepID=A0A0Q3NFV5_BRADI|nr:hypothetical protein BRADI_1g27846v3 [Brachypodium distachyon]
MPAVGIRFPDLPPQPANHYPERVSLSLFLSPFVSLSRVSPKNHCRARAIIILNHCRARAIIIFPAGRRRHSRSTTVDGFRRNRPLKAASSRQ